MMSTVIYLIRHAEADGNKHRVFHGISDSDLTENGIVQAERLSESLAGKQIDRIYSSDLKRAWRTAEPLAKRMNLKILKNSNLREINGGLWENELWEALKVKFPYEYRTWEKKPHVHRMPGGESIKELRERAYTELLRIAEENAGHNVAVFTHGTLIRVLMCRLSGMGEECLAMTGWHENSSVTKLVFENGVFDIEYEGNYDHLDPSQATIANQGWFKMEEYKMKLIQDLFDTQALKVSPHDRPFFYTSGKLGPFYINTHYLYGCRHDAEMLLEMTDSLLGTDRRRIPAFLEGETSKRYSTDRIYKETVDSLVETIKAEIPGSEYVYISGGERRDWFFSYMAARILGKKHLTIFKNMSLLPDITADGGIVHVCDLVTEASSFVNYWLPALKKAGGNMLRVFSVVDRDQGGESFFSDRDIPLTSLIKINRDFFRMAAARGYIDEAQENIIISYLEDPDGIMRGFLLDNTAFLVNALRSGSKDAEKARLLIDKNLYNLPEEYIAEFVHI